MAEIKPDEISAILRQQLSNSNVSAELEEIGTVLQVGDGIARVYGLSSVSSGELVESENGVRAIALNLEESSVGVMVLGDYTRIEEGDTVTLLNGVSDLKIDHFPEALDRLKDLGQRLRSLVSAGPRHNFLQFRVLEVQ